jgi:predicted metal-dependent HD superfamily phosphohydrolase
MENVIEYLHPKWQQLTAFSKKEELKESLWNEIAEQYSESNRHYHNLNHIANLFSLFEKYVAEIKQPAIVGFAIFYHDIVYNTFREDNEEQSALKAREHLQQLNINKSLLQNIESFILATKDHEVPADFPFANDLSYFLDFDVAILGSKWEDYFRYSHNIRKEYGQFPDAVYKAGRKQALERLLNKQQFFYTPQLKEVYEENSRENINKELSLLQTA